MSVRTAMANLIVRTRRLIGDETSVIFDDQHVQDALDVYRGYHRYERLTPQADIAPGGTRIWTNFFHAEGDWEEDAQLTDATYNVLSPDTSDYLTGHWVFNSGVQNGVVWIKGQTYDIYGTGADLCEAWAAKVVLQFDFSDQNVKYQRSQQSKQLLEQGGTLRMRAKPHSIAMIRNDIPSSNMTALQAFNSGYDFNQTRLDK